jgi:hypothetical protein
MSQEREVIPVKANRGTTMQEELMKMEPQERVARLISVMDRGMTGERLKVNLPNDVYGEWVPNDKMEIYRMESMGFRIDEEYALKNALHNDGSGKPIIGDVIFMTTPKLIREAQVEASRRKYIETHGDPKDKNKLHAEEKAFLSSLKHEGGVPAVVNSTEVPVNLSEIAESVKAGMNS